MKKKVSLPDGDLKKIAEALFDMGAVAQGGGDYHAASQFQQKAQLLAALESEPQMYPVLISELQMAKKRRLEKAKEDINGPRTTDQRRTGGNQHNLTSREHLAELMSADGYSAE